jgi:chromate transporter
VKVSFAEALRFWVRLGFISFGGPAGQIAIMHRELVDRKQWISESRFLHALSYCMLLPGPEAQQLATYIGWLLHRGAGGLAAGAFFVIPSIFILLGLSFIYTAHGQLGPVAGVLSGLKPVVVALVFLAVLSIGKRAVRQPASLLIAAAAFIAIYFFHLPFPFIVLAAAACGLLRAGGARKWKDPLAPAEPLPEGEAPSRARTARIVAVALALWALPFAALLFWRGAGSLYATLYRFFTQAAFLTFGGAYAVLAYVTQEAVDSYGWLTRVQAVDGLALAETTPGPLIMVLQFVGFLAGWNHPEALSRLGSATLAALLTTYATFLPSFIFIFLGAPHIERLRQNRRLVGALEAVTAAVVGVILNLGLLFGFTVLWPGGPSQGVDLFAAALCGAAGLALHILRIELLWVILGGGLLGLGKVLLFG